MEDYELGTTLADEFDIANELLYSPTDKSFVRSSNSAAITTLPLDLASEAEHVVAIQFDKDTYTLDTTKDTIASLFQDWGIPKVATGHLFVEREAQGLFSITEGRTHCCWYHVPVVHVDADFKYGALHVWQVQDIETSRIRLLVFYPSFMAARIHAMLSSLFFSSSGLGDLLRSHIHLALIRAAIETWKDTRWAVMARGGFSLRRMAVAVDNALDAGPIRNCHQSLLLVSLTTNYLVRLRRIMAALCRWFKGELLGLDGLATHPALLYMQNFENDIDFLMDSYSHLREVLIQSRHTLSTSIEINNASYMRANTIALRRIAEQNQIEARQAKSQAEIVHKNSQSMTKIAYVTTIYLPANFIATCFGMPFLDLDDGQRFSHLNKIWIYIVVSVASTALTFLASRVWDLFLADHERQEQMEAIEPHPNNDGPLLEPRPQPEPEPEEIMQQLIATVRRRNNHCNPERDE